VSVGATRTSRRSAARSRGWRPTIGGAPGDREDLARRPPPAARSARARAGRGRRARPASRGSPAAPRFIASTAVATEPKPVSTSTGVAGAAARGADDVEPAPPGSLRSVSTRSKRSPRRVARAAAGGPPTATTSCPLRRARARACGAASRGPRRGAGGLERHGCAATSAQRRSSGALSSAPRARRRRWRRRPPDPPCAVEPQAPLVQIADHRRLAEAEPARQRRVAGKRQRFARDRRVGGRAAADAGVRRDDLARRAPRRRRARRARCAAGSGQRWSSGSGAPARWRRSTPSSAAAAPRPRRSAR
jgi:hypothetical protein